MSAAVAPPARSSRKPVAAARFRELLPGAVENQPMVTVGRLRQAEQRLQQPMHAGRPEQVAAAHHLGHALHGVVDRHREVVTGRRLAAGENNVSPGLGPGDDRAGLACRTLAAFDPGQIARGRAGRRHIEPQRKGCTRLKPLRALVAGRAASRHRDRAAPRRGRAAIGRSPRAARSVWRSRPGFQNSDKAGPGPKAFRSRRGSRQDVGIAAAPAPPTRSQASRGPRRSRSRIPACSGPGRCPRCAAGIVPPACRAKSKFSNAE